MHVQFSGRYRLQVFHGDTDILLKDTGWFDNLITNNGMDLICTGLAYGYAFVGSGTATPAVTDTSLQTLLATSASNPTLAFGVQTSALPYYGWEQRVYTFGIGAIQGVVSEVGIGVSSGNLFSRALLTGTNGTTTTLTLGGVDRLALTYEIRQYIDVSDHTYTIDINGVSTSSLTRPAQINSIGNSSRYFWSPSIYNGLGIASGGMAQAYYGGTSPFVGAITGSPSGSSNSDLDRGNAAYIPGSFYRDMYAVWNTTYGDKVYTAMRFLMNSANGLGNGGGWQFSLEPSVTKTQYQNFRLDFRISWSRYP